ncbi:MAG TPA: hypothetical protein VLW25_10040 [Bryobacteraceae bacterium]|nr:hypothetical protein [Bryobacteraceae bacterium]
MPSGFYTDYDPADFYVWTPPSKALSIHLRLAMVKRLEDEHLNVAARGTRQELAGVLLGYSLSAPQPASFIEDFVVLHERDEVGPAQGFRGEVLAQKLGALARRAGLQQTPLGFFRWQRGGWLSLSDLDLEAANCYFSNPEDVILLLRYSTGRGNEGAFFWREAGVVRFRDAHYEFPFSAAKLAQPIAAPAPKPALPPQPQPASQKLEPSPLVQTPSQPRAAARWMPVVHTAAIAMILTGAGVAALENSHSSPPHPEAEPQRTGYQSLLGLSVTARSGQLLIQWNRQAPAIQGAQNALLRIVDGPVTDVSHLDAQQLRDGYVAYQPSTTNLDVRLEVKTRDGGAAAESVRFVGTAHGG